MIALFFNFSLDTLPSKKEEVIRWPKSCGLKVSNLVFQNPAFALYVG